MAQKSDVKEAKDSQILIKDVDGARVVTLAVNMNDLVWTAKNQFKAITGMPIKHQGWIFAARQLRNNQSLAGGGLSEGTTIYLCRAKLQTETVADDQDEPGPPERDPFDK